MRGALCGECRGGKIGDKTIDLATLSGVSFLKPEGETGTAVEACAVCSRLHWPVSGEAVASEAGKRAFLYQGKIICL